MKVSCFLCIISFKKLLSPQVLLVIIGSGVGAINTVFYCCIEIEATNPSLEPEIGVLAVVYQQENFFAHCPKLKLKKIPNLIKKL